MMNGGLGNQTFQYIFSKVIEELTGEECFIDDSSFFGNVQHNGYELERVFGVKPKLLSSFFSEDVWDSMIKIKEEGISIPEQLLKNGLDFFVIREGKDFEFSGNSVELPPHKVSEDIVYFLKNTKGNIYYYGYWIRSKWLKIIKEKIIKELQFPSIEDDINKYYQDKINTTNSIAVHIRRGDFVSLGWELDNRFYYGAVKEMSIKNKNATYFIFSDDIEWCKKNEEELGFKIVEGNVIYIEGNYGRDAYKDMQLMAMCKKIIMSNSSFCYLAALLNTNEKLKVLTPMPDRCL